MTRLAPRVRRRDAAMLGISVVSLVVAAASWSPGPVAAQQTPSLIRSSSTGSGPTVIPAITGTPCFKSGRYVYRPSTVSIAACTPPTTSTTAAPTTTKPPTTTAAPTTTKPPTTTAPPTTTVPPGPGVPNVPSTGFDRNAWIVPGIVPRSSAAEPSGNFRSFCGFEKVGYFDPIVYPGQTNVGHLHQYFGNTDAHGASTYQSLRSSGASTCQGGPLNRTAYWAPTLFDASGAVIVPNYMGLYYKGNGTIAEIQSIQDLPNGLRMIAGFDMANPTNVSMPYGSMAPEWVCDGLSQRSSLVGMNCPAGSELKVGLRFPQCWDGKALDSTNHRSHLAYGTGGGGWVTKQSACPASHPIHLPELTVFIAYTSDGAVNNWYLSSDRMPGMTHANGSTFHADWFGAWDNAVQSTWTQKCIREMRDCNFGELGDGTQLRHWEGTYSGPTRIAGYTPTYQ